MFNPPHTVLVGGLLKLGTPLPPEPLKPVKPSHHKKATLMQKPAKPTKAKIKDEDYSTPYQPPVATPLKRVAQLSVGLEAFVIEDNIPLPDGIRGVGKAALMYELVGKLKPGQSALLDISNYASLNKAKTQATKKGLGKYTCRSNKADKTLRLWRVA